MLKRMLLGALICANLALLAAVVLTTLTPKQAFAQSTGLSDNYLAITVEAQGDFDTLYVTDLRTREMRVFFFKRGENRMTLGAVRNLEEDFRGSDRGR